MKKIACKCGHLDCKGIEIKRQPCGCWLTLISPPSPRGTNGAQPKKATRGRSAR